MSVHEFSAPIARQIWEQKYRLSLNGVPVESSLRDTLLRVAKAAASVETGGDGERAKWANRFFEAMASLQFIPGGRILAGAGSQRDVTLFNCFVLGPIGDDLGAIFESVKEAALTMQAGGGIGHDFSTLRPRGARVRGVGADASGPVSFMDVWDAMCSTILSAGQRRGAMMGTLRCDHPDIEEFVAAKSDPRRLRNFNLSVLVTDAFMHAVKFGGAWDLVFEGAVYKQVEPRALWEKIVAANYTYSEPGVIFIDRANALNNLSYCENIVATNPCGEQPLPPYGACLLGSINLAALIAGPFTAEARLDDDILRDRVAAAVRFLDNVIDLSKFPLPEQEREAKAKRRIGLGITGLADALIMVGLRYGSQASLDQAQAWMRTIHDAAYLASAEIASEKGVFPLYDETAFLSRPNVGKLSGEVRAVLAKQGLRNGCLTSIAPAGTISLLAGNVSSGIEPVFDFQVERRVRDASGVAQVVAVEDYAFGLYRKRHGGTRPSGNEWVRAADLTPHEHLAMQAALQPYVDSAISKTINCPVDIEPSAFGSVYLEAYERGLKGCTLFRPNSVTGSILAAPSAGPFGSKRVSKTLPKRERNGGSLGGSTATYGGDEGGGFAEAETVPVSSRARDFAEVAGTSGQLLICPRCHKNGLSGDPRCSVCLECGHEACS